MIDPSKLDALAKSVYEHLPSSVKNIKEDLSSHLKGALQHALEKMEMVSREEFDVQSQLLSNCKIQIDGLQKRLDDLEKSQKKPSKTKKIK
jgi:hypothetical protein